jgi:hypothetical protein
VVTLWSTTPRHKSHTNLFACPCCCIVISAVACPWDPQHLCARREVRWMWSVAGGGWGGGGGAGGPVLAPTALRDCLCTPVVAVGAVYQRESD